MKTAWNGKVAIVAGASGGIGSAVCRQLIEAGWTVVGVARQVSPLENTGSARLGDRLVTCVADLSTTEGWSAAVDLARERFGSIDAMINCVGAIEKDGRDFGSVAELARVMKLNVEVSILGARAVLPVMIQQRRPAVIVTVGSLGALLPMPGRELYTAAKFAVRGFSLALDAALRRTRVRACLLQPGPVWTPMLDGEIVDGHSPMSLAISPVGPERVARAVARLLEHPRAEMLMPMWGSVLTRLAGAFPLLHRLLLPHLEHIGAARLERCHRDRTTPSTVGSLRAARVTS